MIFIYFHIIKVPQERKAKSDQILTQIGSSTPALSEINPLSDEDTGKLQPTVTNRLERNNDSPNI